MRAWKAATLPICLLLAACAGGKLPGEQPASDSAYTPSVTAAPRGQTATSLDPPEGSDGERVQQARAACWMKVESEKNLRGIDQRIAYVEKCVNEQVKNRHVSLRAPPVGRMEPGHAGNKCMQRLLMPAGAP